jgi:hypothetical protein
MHIHPHLSPLMHPHTSELPTLPSSPPVPEEEGEGCAIGSWSSMAHGGVAAAGDETEIQRGEMMGKRLASERGGQHSVSRGRRVQCRGGSMHGAWRRGGSGGRL